MYGRRESGKTYFVTGMLFQQEKFIKDPFTKVIWINKSFQKDMYEKLMHANQFELEFNPILNGGGVFLPPQTNFPKYLKYCAGRRPALFNM